MAEDVFGIVGTTVAGNFHVERVVAEGGFGVVYRALHGGFRAPVAIKVLKVPTTMTADQRETFLRKFSEEAEMLFRLSASIPEVVRPLHVDVIQQADGNVAPFLALEWLEGEPFDQILARRRATGQPMAMHKLVKTLRPIAHALARAHHFHGPEGVVSIIHRDLKPENIFISVVNGVEKVKILDFGIARTKSVATQMAGRVTGGEGLNAFTPAYGAPEQWVPKRFGQTGPWTDVWGLAITMVEALCGHSPIDGEIPAMMGTALDERRRPTPRNEGVSVSDDIERVFERALAVDPRARTKDVDTFWSELEAALGMSSSFVSRDGRRDPTSPMPSDPPMVATRAGGLGPPSGAAPPQVVATPVPAPAPAPSSTAEIPTLELRRPPEAAAARALGGAATLEAVPTQRSGASDRPAPRVPTLVTEKRPAPAASPRPASPPAAPLAPPATLDPFDDVEPLAAELDLSPRRAPAFDVAVRPVARPAPPVPLDASPASRRRPPPGRPDPVDTSQDMAELRDRLRGPLVIVGIAVVIAMVDLFVANTQGQLLRIEGVRPLWIAAPLAILGVATAFWRLLGDRDG